MIGAAEGRSYLARPICCVDGRGQRPVRLSCPDMVLQWRAVVIAATGGVIGVLIVMVAPC